MQTIEDALKEYRERERVKYRKKFFEEIKEGYAALKADPVAWQEELQERKLWEEMTPLGAEVIDD